MHHGQTIDQNGHVVPVETDAFGHILVDDLQAVVVDVVLVDQPDILVGSIIPLQHLNVIALDTRGLLNDAIIGTCHVFLEEALPLAVGELDVIEKLQLLP